MPRKKQDFAERAHEAFLESIGEKPKTKPPEKDPAAAALGSKGGKATAAKRTAAERSAAAKKAVEARWARSKKD